MLVGAGSCEQGTEKPQPSPDSPERPRAYVEETMDISKVFITPLGVWKTGIITFI